MAEHTLLRLQHSKGTGGGILGWKPAWGYLIETLSQNNQMKSEQQCFQYAITIEMLGSFFSCLKFTVLVTVEAYFNSH